VGIGVRRGCWQTAVVGVTLGMLAIAVGAVPAAAVTGSDSQSGPLPHNGGLPVLAASIALLVVIGIGGWVLSVIGRRSGKGPR